jgi:DnaJ-class molecular chaperone
LNKDKDYYKILGLDTSADTKEIKSAYRALARKYHPDTNQGNKLSEEKFKEIGEAYSVLNDPAQKTKYDMLRGLSQKQPNKSEQAKKQASEAYSESKKTSEKAAEKQKKEPDKKPFGDVFSDFVEKIFEKETPKAKPQEAKKETSKPEPKKGDDITADISITIVEAHNGTVRKVNILHTETCPKCKGKRYTNGSQCTFCKSNGEISQHKKISVKIPPNVKEGSKIRIAGEGNKGQNGGANGDLFLLISIIKNAIFEYENLNVLCEIPITPTEAALGADIMIPTIEGQISMKIPPETSSGKKFRLSGEGIPDANNSKRGDQIVTVRIEIPHNLSAKEKELYIELGKIRKSNPREKMVFS